MLLAENQIIQCALDDLIKEKRIRACIIPYLGILSFQTFLWHLWKIDKDKPLSDIERVFLKDPKDRPFSKEDTKI